MILTSYQCLFRGNDIRGVRLCDLFYKELPNTAGPDLVTMIGIISSEGKKNQA